MYSDAALREYVAWVGGRSPHDQGLLKFSYDASIRGSKLQDYPISPGPRKFVLGQEPAPINLTSILIGFVLGYVGKDWFERKGRAESVIGGVRPGRPSRWWD